MDELKPEEQARVLIDEMLAAAGWAVVPRSEYKDVPFAQALEEALTKGNNRADYQLYLDGKAIGVLEAKRLGKNLGACVAEQVAKYSVGTLPWNQAWTNPLPFLFMSDGDKLLRVNIILRLIANLRHFRCYLLWDQTVCAFVSVMRLQP